VQHRWEGPSRADPPLRYHHSYCCLTYMIGWNKRGPQVRAVAVTHSPAGSVTGGPPAAAQCAVFLAQRPAMSLGGASREPCRGVVAATRAVPSRPADREPWPARVKHAYVGGRVAGAAHARLRRPHSRARVRPPPGSKTSGQTYRSTSWTVPGAEFDWGGTSPKR